MREKERKGEKQREKRERKDRYIALQGPGHGKSMFMKAKVTLRRRDEKQLFVSWTKDAFGEEGKI